MAIDRESALRKAEKLLRQGRLDQAIEEYVRLVEDQPRDLTTANALGDLCVRAGRIEQAVAQYARIAGYLAREGFLPKAAALYKKILKVSPHDESALLQAADLAARQGLLADARGYLTAVIERRTARGDLRGAAEIRVRLGGIDPADVPSNVRAARARAELGDGAGAAAALRALAADLRAKHRDDEARNVLEEAVHLDAGDGEGRIGLAALYAAQGAWERAAALLPDNPGADPEIRVLAVEVRLRTGAGDAVAEELGSLAEERPELVAKLAERLAADAPESAFRCAEAVCERGVVRQDWPAALAPLQAFVAQVPDHVPALMKLVEVCVDAGLEVEVAAAQAQLADAYLLRGSGHEARVIAEDLVARDPLNPAHRARLRQALVLLGEPDPDRAVAERLTGPAPILVPALDFDLSDLPASDRGPAVAGPPDVIEVDLSQALEGLVVEAVEPPGGDAAAEEPPLDEVFQHLRVAADRLSAADAARDQYQRALQLEAAGRDVEAAALLELAARSPRLRFEAAGRLARLLVRCGRPQQAVDWFERAAQAPAPTPDANLELLYDLGLLLEENGEWARALAVYLELQTDTGAYRDVDARVDRLTKSEMRG
ncbi:MAG: tetratricopeptide repeat protein [Acidobacteriota bacterium]|nr:tetratricopeptide repeat protein [Acidobacteriota bacterium]